MTPQTQSVVAVVSAVEDVPEKIPEKSHNPECCCGSPVCHAGVAAAVTVLLVPEARGERVRGETAFGLEQGFPSGLERPPRGVAAL